MRHTKLAAECLGLGMQVRQEPAEGHHAFLATEPSLGVRVYWTASYTGLVMGLPRCQGKGFDTHVRNVKELRWLVRREQ